VEVSKNIFHWGPNVLPVILMYGHNSKTASNGHSTGTQGKANVPITTNINTRKIISTFNEKQQCECNIL
jgi:hypothetical protein